MRRMRFILMTGFFGTSLNFVPNVSASLPQPGFWPSTPRILSESSRSHGGHPHSSQTLFCLLQIPQTVFHLGPLFLSCFIWNLSDIHHQGNQLLPRIKATFGKSPLPDSPSYVSWGFPEVSSQSWPLLPRGPISEV